jgi:hypothetical protein
MHPCGGRSRVQPLSRPTDCDPLLRVEYEFQLIAHRFAKMLIDPGERDSEHFALRVAVC